MTDGVGRWMVVTSQGERLFDDMLDAYAHWRAAGDGSVRHHTFSGEWITICYGKWVEPGPTHQDRERERRGKTKKQ